MAIGKTKDGYLIHQYPYAAKLTELEMNCSFDDFRVRRHELAGINHMRRDLCASVAKLSQVTEKGLIEKL